MYKIESYAAVFFAVTTKYIYIYIQFTTTTSSREHSSKGRSNNAQR